MKNIRTQKMLHIINTDEFRRAIVENAVSMNCFVMTSLLATTASWRSWI